MRNIFQGHANLLGQENTVSIELYEHTNNHISFLKNWGKSTHYNTMGFCSTQFNISL